MRKVLLTIHLYLGLYFGVIILLASCTGTALLFKEEIDAAQYPDLLQVRPGETRASVNAAYRNVALNIADADIQYIRFFQKREKPIEFWLTGDEGMRAYADPYTGEFLGKRNANTSITGILFQLHTKLFAGNAGHIILGITGLALVLLCISGLYLWWPGVKNIRAGLQIAFRSSWRRMNYDLHRAGGFWTAALVLCFALTGTILIWYGPVSSALHAVTGEEESQNAITITEHADTGDINFNQVIASAKSAIENAEITFLYLPMTPEQPVTVRLRMDHELHPNGRSYVTLHPGNYQVLDRSPAPEATTATRIMNLMYPLHIGSFGGVLIKILYVITGMAPAVLTITGFFIWFARSRRRKRRKRTIREEITTFQNTEERITTDAVPH